MSEVKTRTDADVFIFTKDDCTNCDSAKALLDRKGIEFDYLNISSPGNEHFVEELREEGVMQMPYIITKAAGSWTGRRPDKLMELASSYRKASVAA